eukprot:COSAG04_NODE_1860_length_5374_cov_3.470142_1_plen_118_part_10
MEGSSSSVVNPMAEVEAGAEPGSPGGPALQQGKEPSESASRLPEEMPTDAPGLQAFLQKSMAIRSESPLNLHQATAYFCLWLRCKARTPSASASTRSAPGAEPPPPPLPRPPLSSDAF